MRTLGEEIESQGFDLTVTHRDGTTGLVVEKTPYIMRVDNRVRYWERPAGSGNLFNKKGDPCGRWDKTKPEGQRYDAKAKHVAFTPPETLDSKLRRESLEKDAQIAALQKEISSIKGEATQGKAAKGS